MVLDDPKWWTAPLFIERLWPIKGYKKCSHGHNSKEIMTNAIDLHSLAFIECSSSNALHFLPLTECCSSKNQTGCLKSLLREGLWKASRRLPKHFEWNNQRQNLLQNLFQNLRIIANRRISFQ